MNLNATIKHLDGEWTVRVRDGKISAEIYDYKKDRSINFSIKSPEIAIGLGKALVTAGVKLKNGN